MAWEVGKTVALENFWSNDFLNYLNKIDLMGATRKLKNPCSSETEKHSLYPVCNSYVLQSAEQKLKAEIVDLTIK